MWIKQVSALLTIVYAYIGSGYAQTNDCGLERFQCYNGECIAGELLCDGKANCKDSSDETQAECMKPEILCPDYAFRCKYGACINGDAVCNNVQDCVDNSDETQPQCTRTSENNNQTATQCRTNQFTCDNGQCINSIDVCDGDKNCLDGSDEVYARCGSFICPPTVFRCTYGACIDGNLRCNGVINCADGSDENPQLCGGTRWPSPLPPVTITPQPGTTTERSSGQSSSSTVSSGIKTCKAPPQPQNGHWKLHRSQCSNTRQDCDISQGVNLEPGSHLIYSCDEGFQIRGSIDVSCSFEGKWLNIPFCTEIRCKALSSASIRAECTYNGEWASCDSPVLPRTRAKLYCRNSYQPESNQVLSTQRDFVTCNANGQWEPEPIRCTPVCGIPPSNVTPLVIGGYQPNITEFPWHASLYLSVSQDKPKEFFCGASIIQENLLITAAHCIYDEDTRQVIDPKKIYIATGNIFRDYDYPSPYVTTNQVKHIYTICNYLGFSGNYIRDIAILELAKPFVLSATLVPVCIDLLSDRRVLEAGAVGKVAGFGRTADGKSSAILQTLTVPYIPFSQCKSASQDVNTQQYLTTDKFCAGYTNGSSVCDGDSGGGLVFKTNGLWYLRGIVSVSLGTILQGGSAHCNNNLYSLYTQISSHIDWIQNVIQIVKLQYNQPHIENVCKK
ncbi:modular serine protease-like [Cataglyphis hispanica]|uniref:modular serine protease-like n=1 Tax=Cataglyphis hispanica TaxID=1086592 RepID=UPI002180069E|nr:modular serine protease-like [Cataglyphis hispanica]